MKKYSDHRKYFYRVSTTNRDIISGTLQLIKDRAL